jgi:thioredoxin reductase
MSDRARANAPKATRTSDVTRPRTLALATLGAAAGVTAAVVAQGTPHATERPIAQPHAKVACASCHSPAASASAPAPAAHTAAACKTCHGTAHSSVRRAHRELAAKGELPCATCHGQHAEAQGVTFEDGAVVRWGAGAQVALLPSRKSGVQPGAIAPGTTVPLVPLAACARCHDPSRSEDPIAACVPSEVRLAGPDAGASALHGVASRCFDEHRRLDEPAPSAGSPACARQHGATRFVAWEAARDVAATTPWVAPVEAEGPPWAPPAGALAGALVVGVAATAIDRRRRRAAGTKEAAVPVAAAARKRLPTIDTSTCLGCYACVDACPFDVLAIERYVAVVARPEECCGVVLCEQVCPNGSLRVEDGEPIADRPATDEHLESRDVSGLFLAGDLTGLPLIKNAINQGARAVDRIAQTLPRRRAEPIDVIVIGAGPAGLSAALRAKERDLACVVLEQATVAASIKSFPRDKIVHDPPLDLPVEGELWLKEATKEELLAQWARIVRARSLDVREGHRVIDVAKDERGFTVTVEHDGGSRTSQLRASRVVLAIGRRGMPRRLDLEIERGAEDRVAYALADARSFKGKRVVVVGLGDSAMEAAIALARQPGTSVTISYRGSRFARGKAKNIAEVQSLVARKKIKILFETIPVAVTHAGVVLEGTGAHAGRRAIGADAMLVLIGGVPAWDLLTRAGIRRPRRKEPAASDVRSETRNLSEVDASNDSGPRRGSPE